MQQFNIQFPADSQATAGLMVQEASGRYRPATADEILAASRVAIEEKMKRGLQMTSPDKVKDYLRAKLAGFEHEVFAVLFLDNQHRLIAYREMFSGTISSAAVYPREIVKAALASNAAAVILAHNHPSGNSDPSGADERVTRQIQQGLGLVEVRLLDHVIIAGNAAKSFAESGLL